MSVHAGRRQLGRLLLEQPAARAGLSRPTAGGRPARARAWSARPNNPAATDPQVGPIGTLPRYYENGLVSDGDRRSGSARSAGPTASSLVERRAAVLRQPDRELRLPGVQGLRGDRRLAASTSRTRRRAKRRQQRVAAPVIVSKQNGALFSDQEMIAVDNAADEPVLRERLHLQRRVPQPGEGRHYPEPISSTRSSDGGNTWRGHSCRPGRQQRVGGRQDCAVNTDSRGTLYVFWDGFDSKAGRPAIFEIRSFDGGKTFDRPARIVTHFDETGLRTRSPGDLRNDGVAGARDGSFPTATSPTAPRPARTRVTRSCSRTRTARRRRSTTPARTRRSACSTRATGGVTTGSAARLPTTDRPDFPAIAISPDGQEAWLDYMDFLAAVAVDAALARPVPGVVRHAALDPGGVTGSWSDVDRASWAMPAARARTSSRTGSWATTTTPRREADAVAVWNDT